MDTRKIIIAVAILSVGLLTAFQYSSTKGTAKVEQQQGIYIYYLSMPTTAYDSIGNYSLHYPFTSLLIHSQVSANPLTCLTELINGTKNNYPQADGIIINKIMNSATVIRFK